MHIEDPNLKINKTYGVISKDFPFQTLYSNRHEVSPMIKPKLKPFPERKGANREAPDFLRLKNVPDNKFTYENPYLEKISTSTRPNGKNTEYFKSNENSPEIKKYYEGIYSNLKQHKCNLTMKMKKQTLVEEKPFEYNKKIKKQKNNYQQFFETLYCPASPSSPGFHRLEDGGIEKISTDKQSENNLTSLKRSFSYADNMSTHLKNLNDYQVSDFSKYLNEKFISYERKPVKVYDPIVDKLKKIDLPNIQHEKWTNYYEKYYEIKEIDNTGFKRKKELFSDICDRNKIFMQWKKDQKMFDTLQAKNQIELEYLEKLNKSQLDKNNPDGTAKEEIADVSGSKKKVRFSPEKPKKLLPPYYMLMTTYKGKRPEGFIFLDEQSKKRNITNTNTPNNIAGTLMPNSFYKTNKFDSLITNKNSTLRTIMRTSSYDNFYQNKEKLIKLKKNDIDYKQTCVQPTMSKLNFSIGKNPILEIDEFS